jgi:delta 1-pyrroline-5-carboxylate dehydrogenase
MALMNEVTAPAKTYENCVRRAAAASSISPQYDAAVERGNAALDDIEQAVRRWVAAHPEPAAVQAPAADRAALRDRIAAAIYERNNPGLRWADAHPDDLVCYGNDADAAMSVLPAPTDRAAVLREAADRLDAGMEQFFTEWPDEPRNSPYALGQKDAATELRRMADEAQP